MSQHSEWKRVRRRRKRRVILRVILILAVMTAAGACLRIRNVTMEGNTHYTKAEMEQQLFPTDWDRNPFVFLVKERLGRGPVIPFVDRYTVTLTGLQSVDVIVYEKDIIGCVQASGKYVYFDRDGIVVEISGRKIEDVPLVSGIDAGKPVSGEQLPVSDSTILDEILNVSQYLGDTEVEMDGETGTLVSMTQQIEIAEDGSVTVDFGDIRVCLGTSENMEEKLLTMTDILPKLSGRTGTLYLDTYDPANENPAYVFK